MSGNSGFKNIDKDFINEQFGNKAGIIYYLEQIDVGILYLTTEKSTPT